MKLPLVLLALVTFAFSGPVLETEEEDGGNMTYFVWETSEGVYKIEDLVNAELDLRASESDITYHFYSRNNPTEGISIKASDISVIQGSQFKPHIDTVFVVHGWKDEEDSTYNVQMRQTVLSQHDVNVFVVDWAPIAAKNYISAKGSVVKVGTYIASFIEKLVTTYGLDLSKVTFVGHSLGAHIAGNAGAALGGKVGRIVGLDPAGPLFTVKKTSERLDPTDAKFVQAIHTNGGLLGFKSSLGHADYYPNGGASQAGCTLDIFGTCAHARSYAYYADTVLSNKNALIGTQCASYSRFKSGRCSSNAKSAMGGYYVDTSAKGDYYLKTNKKAPYGTD